MSGRRISKASEVVRTDNGIPFGAPTALGGLSTLAVWRIRLGIRPERIHKGAPQENGAHERMRRTLKAETTRPAAAEDEWTIHFGPLAFGTYSESLLSFTEALAWSPLPL
jgi:transposase InsO family protein